MQPWYDIHNYELQHQINWNGLMYYDKSVRQIPTYEYFTFVNGGPVFCLNQMSLSNSFSFLLLILDVTFFSNPFGVSRSVSLYSIRFQATSFLFMLLIYFCVICVFFSCSLLFMSISIVKSLFLNYFFNYFFLWLLFQYWIPWFPFHILCLKNSNISNNGNWIAFILCMYLLLIKVK